MNLSSHIQQKKTAVDDLALKVAVIELQKCKAVLEQPEYRLLHYDESGLSHLAGSIRPRYEQVLKSVLCNLDEGMEVCFGNTCDKSDLQKARAQVKEQFCPVDLGMDSAKYSHPLKHLYEAVFKLLHSVSPLSIPSMTKYLGRCARVIHRLCTYLSEDHFTISGTPEEWLGKTKDWVRHLQDCWKNWKDFIF